MKPIVKTLAASTLLVLSLSSTPALAAKIGVTMSAFDDNFLTALERKNVGLIVLILAITHLLSLAHM